MTTIKSVGRPVFEVVSVDGRYQVLSPEGEPIGPPHISRRDAEAARGHLQKRRDKSERVEPRACMCCGTIFPSEGIHNRLCTACRGQGDRLDPWGPSLAQVRARRGR